MTNQIKNKLNKWNMRRMTAFALALSLLLSACEGIDFATSMRLKKMVGDVRVNDDKDKDVEARVDLGLYSGYAVNTEAESYAWVDLDSVKLAKLDQSSKIAIEKDGGNLTINVKSGNLFFDITEPLKDDESLSIRMSTLAIGIRGTRGWVEVPEEGETMRVYLLEGKVECTAGDQTAMVEAGEMATMTAEGEITVEPLPDDAIPAFVQEELDNDAGDNQGDNASASDWEKQTGLTDHDMDWKDENLAKKMVEITGISDRAIRLSDVWDMQSLEIREAGISDISALGELTNLTILDLMENQISDITSLGNLTRLNSLNLGGNQISDVSSLGKLRGMTFLRLGWNQISDISALSSLTNMIELHLYGNQITDVTPLGSMTNMISLQSGSNQISDISALGSLTNLTQLELSSNQISDISALGSLTNLTRLALSSNQISDISPLGNLTNLTQLDLSSNQISDFGPLGNLTNLTNPHTGWNPGTYVP